MFSEVRKQEILKLVNEKGNVTVEELCDFLNMSPATIRNDLNTLKREGLLERTHGGAVSIIKSVYELNTEQKTIQYANEKEWIAEAASLLIKPNEAIALDSGTTTFELAKKLVKIHPLTVVTNDLQIALWLEQNTMIQIILIGGEIRKGFHCTTGNTTIEHINKLRVDKAFIGTNGVSLDSGFSTPNIEHASYKNKLVECSNKKIILCDSSKFGRRSLAKFAEFEDIDIIITDYNVSNMYVNAITKTNTKVIKTKPAKEEKERKKK